MYRKKTKKKCVSLIIREQESKKPFARELARGLFWSVRGTNKIKDKRSQSAVTDTLFSWFVNFLRFSMRLLSKIHRTVFFFFPCVCVSWVKVQFVIFLVFLLSKVLFSHLGYDALWRPVDSFVPLYSRSFISSALMIAVDSKWFFFWKMLNNLFFCVLFLQLIAAEKKKIKTKNPTT